MGAQDLVKTGLRVLILEARNRPGGRILTDRTTFGCVVECGAHWIHGATKKNPLKQLADQLGLRRVVTHEDEALYNEQGEEYSSDEEEELENTFDKVGQKVMALKKQYKGRDMSIADAVELALGQVNIKGGDRKKAWHKQYAKLQIVSENAADWENISFLDWEEDESFGEKPEEMFPEGYDQIITGLAHGLDIRYEQIVQSINYRPGSVKISVGSGEVYWATRCVVTLSVGCLQADDIIFIPPLPAPKQEALRQVGMGVLNCLTLQFAQKFWPDRPNLFSSIKYHDVNVYDAHHCCGSYVLQIHRTGSASIAWESMPEEEVVNEGLQILRDIFHKKVRNIPRPIRWGLSRWNSDPFSKGAYSYTKIGGSRKSYKVIAEPIMQTVFFAGEHCHDQYNNTAHGALLSGHDTARQILNA
eukprot:TRINITY_DN8574_c0_g2_i1.p1 TRINITY_DN8574_c0_g2~~TRINITY_DN8574_c0_g2_i1.p1  ORF type:complete len:426 (+),score=174.91 TRINITY_DN8574_c0_g2_i1:33-1280(+)